MYMPANSLSQLCENPPKLELVPPRVQTRSCGSDHQSVSQLSSPTVRCHYHPTFLPSPQSICLPHMYVKEINLWRGFFSIAPACRFFFLVVTRPQYTTIYGLHPQKSDSRSYFVFLHTTRYTTLRNVSQTWVTIVWGTSFLLFPLPLPGRVALWRFLNPTTPRTV